MNDERMAEWLLRQIDDDLLWAHEASRRGDGPAAEGGVHWRWETPDDQVVTPDPGAAEFVGGPDDFTVSLRSAETWPSRYMAGREYELPQFAVPHAEEVPSVVGGHIVRHDPAQVIRGLLARRRIVERCLHTGPEAAVFADQTLRDLTEAYAERPGYLPEWRPYGFEG